jgi:hypothetical protein
MSFDYFPGGTSIKRPRCSRCTSRMMLTRISPDPLGFEHRSFECPECKSVTEEVVASDPMNSTSEGLPENSGLRIDGKETRQSGSARAMNPIIPNESELRLRWAELQELEQTVIELIATALKLAPGLERRDNLAVIGSFRRRIAAMKRVELARASSLNTA